MSNKYLTMLYTLVLTSLPLHAFAQNGPGNMGSGGRGMMDCIGGGGMMMLFPMLVMVLLIVLLLMGIIALAKYIRQG